MPKTKLTAALYLLLVFLSGAMVGAVAHRLYMVKTVLSTGVNPTPRRPSPAEWRKQFLADMQTKVKIDDRQLVELQHLLDQTDEEFRQLHAQRKPEDQRRRAEDQGVQSQMVDKINAMLRDDQKPLYKQFRDEREAERDRERKRRQAEGDTRK
jgi:succinate dehydrogenase flavin-adding protein (antitoxin of CptAB toxin-antitoxin module)